MTTSILGQRNFYKPFSHAWCFEAYKKQQQAHWIPEEIPIAKDLKEYNFNLTAAEKKIVTETLRFFTQADMDVSNNYMDRLLKHFHLPEVRMMLGTFASFENLHVHAYSYLSDSLNLDSQSNFYSSFMDIKAMREKHNYLDKIEITDVGSLAKCLAIFGGFVEGVQLFSSFAILNSFPRRGLLLGVGQIITWSIRDESLHAQSISRLFREVISEHPSLWTDDFKKELYQACRDCVKLEDAFIDACFDMGDIEGLKAADVKKYVRYMADIRLGDLGLKKNYHVKEHPLPWLETITNTLEHGNMFETKITNYSKGTIIDDLVR
jgi:ribonucleoside-diphosphate reductase beta chain